jgi:branched-chain amino acid transport system permease protein
MQPQSQWAAYQASYIDPSSASLDESILMLSMLLVGRAGNFRGPLVGAAVMIAIPDAVAANLRLLLYGLLLVVMVHLRPQGLPGEFQVQ